MREHKRWVGGLILAAAIVVVAIVLARPDGGATASGRRTGISEDHEVPPYHNQIFSTSNRWLGRVNGTWTQVYAGAKLLAGRGVALRSELVMYALPANPGIGRPPVLIGTYPSPEGGRKPLTIVSFRGDLLEVRTSTGKVITFDAARRTFLTH